MTIPTDPYHYWYGVLRDFDFNMADGGQRMEFDSGMIREPSTGKTRFDLLIPEDFQESSMLVRWAELLTRGADKYEPRNWELAESDDELQRFKESAFRHFMQWYLRAEDEDHAAAVFFNIQGYEYTLQKLTG